MRTLGVLICLLLFITVEAVFAHGDHGHEEPSAYINQSQAKAVGYSKIVSLVNAGKLDGAWAYRQASAAELVRKDKKQLWRVIFLSNNSSVDNKRLIIYLSKKGALETYHVKD